MSGSIRLFTQEALSAGAVVAATPGQGHYLGSVMRRRIGDPVSLFNGRDGEWLARIVSLGRDRVSMEVAAQTRTQLAEPDLWLAFAVLKRDATDLVVQKATELGVSSLAPVLTERTNSERVNLARLASIASEAAEQCERLSVPEVLPPRRFSAFLAEWPADRPLFAAIERRAGRFPPALDHRPSGLLVGPEGGFSPTELDALGSRPFVVPVTLGPRILRAETAAIVGLALLNMPADGG